MAKKILLSESDIPERWYYILPDLPAPPFPYLNPQTLLPMGPADLEARTILFGLSGHGHFDMSAVDAYFAGTLEDVELSQSRIDAAIEELPRVPATP